MRVSRNRAVRDEIYGCELWIGSKNSNGYGTDWRDGRPRLAHYRAWEEKNGPIPKDKVVDHLCRRRTCIALAHLELVSRNENDLRKSWAYRSQLKTCPKGHDLFAHGKQTPEGGHICRTCSGLKKPIERPQVE